MGFYGRHYDRSINDYFNTFRFKIKKYDATTPESDKFPSITDNILTDEANISAIVPAQEVVITAGNPWVQLVVDTENADMGNAATVGHEVTIFHKKANGEIEGKLIDFDKAIKMKDGSPLLDASNRPILNYGGEVAVNTVSFDAAGHASGTGNQIIKYALPQVIEKNQFKEAFQLQQELKETYNSDTVTSLNQLIQNYPFSGAAILETLVDNTDGLTELTTIVKGSSNTGGATPPGEGNGSSIVDSGLVGKVDSLTTQIGELDSQIKNDILPNLGQTAGINKPGLEFNHALVKLQYQSPLAQDQKLNSGNHASVFNYYDINSLYKYSKITFSNATDYIANKYYLKDATGNYILATDIDYDSSKTYYEKVSTNTLLNSNFALGDYSMALGYASRAIGDYSYAANGYFTISGYDMKSYPSIAVGTSSHAEGRSGLASRAFDIAGISGGQFSINDSGYQTFIEADGFTQDHPVMIGSTGLSVGLHISTKDAADQTQVHYKIYPVTSIIDFNQGTLTIPLETGETIVSNTKVEPYVGLAYGDNSHIEGYGTNAFGDNSHAEGKFAIAKGTNAHAEGYASKAEGENAHAEGYISKARGLNSHAEGNETDAGGPGSHAEGYKSGAGGDYAHAEGYQTKAASQGAHAEGYRTEASSEPGAHAEGYQTKASGQGAHAEGTSDGTAIVEALGDGSHAEGGGCHAIGNYSHAEGLQTAANGRASHASGIYTIAQRDASTVIGQYNRIYKNDTLPLFAIGNGTGASDEDRSNAMTIWDDGNCEITGNLRIYNNAIYLQNASGVFYKIYIDENNTLKVSKEQ